MNKSHKYYRCVECGEFANNSEVDPIKDLRCPICKVVCCDHKAGVRDLEVEVKKLKTQIGILREKEIGFVEKGLEAADNENTKLKAEAERLRKQMEPMVHVDLYDEACARADTLQSRIVELENQLMSRPR